MRWFSLLALYRALTCRNAWLGERILLRRLRAGKEDSSRLDERRGRCKTPRPKGPVIWFHAASVGESLSVLALVDILLKAHSSANVLITSGTRTAAAMMTERLHAHCFHAYVPLDFQCWVRDFLDHWRPYCGVWVESEFWPNLILETNARAIPMFLVNARMSKSSYRKWRFMRYSISYMLSCFMRVFVQNEETKKYLTELGMAASRVEYAGSLKAGAAPLPFVSSTFEEMQGAIGGRPCWVAASTHAGEEEHIAAAHRQLCETHGNALLILVPRHPERGALLAARLDENGWCVARRNGGDGISAQTQIYVADTMGELGLWFRLARASFIGGSMVRDIGGHNPYEAAQLGSAILHGPYVENFEEIYLRLDVGGGALEGASAGALGKNVADALGERGQVMIDSAKAVIEGEEDSKEKICALILEALERADEGS